jgi:hypothetical protein
MVQFNPLHSLPTHLDLPETTPNLWIMNCNS